MKNLLIFLFGAACGSAGTLFWLRKDIKKELEMMKNQSSEDEDLPFEMKDSEVKNTENGPENGADEASEGTKNSENNREKGVKMSQKEQDRFAYDKVIADNYTGRPPVPAMPREDDDGGYFVSDVEPDGGIFEIDQDDFMKNETFEQERLVYFRGDKIMSTENGTIITNPAILVGTAWENCVGNYADRTAFIRNSRLVTDYEIYVEDGLYEDEYGSLDYRED